MSIFGLNRDYRIEIDTISGDSHMAVRSWNIGRLHIEPNRAAQRREIATQISGLQELNMESGVMTIATLMSKDGQKLYDQSFISVDETGELMLTPVTEQVDQQQQTLVS